MKLFSITIVLLLGILLFYSCKSKKSVETNEIKQTKAVAQDLSKEGYAKAVVVFDNTKATPCDYLLKLEKGELLEPLEFTDKALKKDEQLVWIKFVRQRRMSRCGNAQPIQIIAIETRE